MPLTLVKDGELYNFDSIQQSGTTGRGLFAKLIDAVGWLKAKIDGIQGGQEVLYHKRFLIDGGDAKWLINGSANAVSQVTTPASIFVELALAHGHTFNTAELTIHPAGSHSALPAAMPDFSVVKHNIATGVGSFVGSTTTVVDPSANTVAYELRHTITVTGINEVIDRTTYVYFGVYDNENSTHAVTGLEVVAVKTTTTRN